MCRNVWERRRERERAKKNTNNTQGVCRTTWERRRELEPGEEEHERNGARSVQKGNACERRRERKAGDEEDEEDEETEHFSSSTSSRETE